MPDQLNPNPHKISEQPFVGTYSTDIHRVDMYRVSSVSFEQIRTKEDLIAWLNLNSNIYIKLQLDAIKAQVEWLELDIREIHSNGSMVQIQTYTDLETEQMKYLNFVLFLTGKTGKDTTLPLNTPVKFIEGEDLFLDPKKVY